jgi:hypothetical protein
MNNPIGPLTKILFGDTEWLLPLGDDEVNLITLTDSLKLRWSIHELARKNFAVGSSNCDPNKLRPPAGDSGTTIVNDHLKGTCQLCPLEYFKHARSIHYSKRLQPAVSAWEVGYSEK